MSADAADAVTDLVRGLTAKHERLGVTMDVSVDEHEISLDSIDRDRKDDGTRGRGADAIRDLCALADEHGLRMETSYMTCEPELGPYYARFGFLPHVVEGGYPHLLTMRRPARPR